VSGSPDGFTASSSEAGASVLLINLVATTSQLTLADPGPSGYNVLILQDPLGVIQWTEGGNTLYPPTTYAATTIINGLATPVWSQTPPSTALVDPPGSSLKHKCRASPNRAPSRWRCWASPASQWP